MSRAVRPLLEELASEVQALDEGEGGSAADDGGRRGDGQQASVHRV
jgi:hypothetical protein